MLCMRGFRSSRRKAAIIAIAMTPIGRLTQKITDHERCCTMKAPSTGPMIAETPQTLPR